MLVGHLEKTILPHRIIFRMFVIMIADIITRWYSYSDIIKEQTISMLKCVRVFEWFFNCLTDFRSRLSISAMFVWFHLVAISHIRSNADRPLKTTKSLRRSFTTVRIPFVLRPDDQHTDPYDHCRSGGKEISIATQQKEMDGIASDIVCRSLTIFHWMCVSCASARARKMYSFAPLNREKMRKSEAALEVKAITWIGWMKCTHMFTHGTIGLF